MVPADDPLRTERNRIHIDVWVPYDQAEARVAAAIAADGRLVTDQYAPAWWVLADAQGNEACVTTVLSRDRAVPGDAWAPSAPDCRMARLRLVERRRHTTRAGRLRL